MEVVYEKLSEGFRPRSQRIGLEIERIGCCVDQKVIRYESHIEPLLKALRDHQGWESTYESEGHLLGLKKGQNAISLEPGAQFELATEPVSSVSEIREIQENLDYSIRQLPFARRWTWMDLGLNPVDRAESLPLLPSSRYRLMDQYFQSIEGGRGRDMMRLTAGFQVNVDTPSEEKALQLLRVAFYLAPLFTALYPHSPYWHGKATGRLAERHFIWKKTDPQRCLFLNDVLEKSFSVRDYADYAAKIPLMYAFDEEGSVYDPKGASLRDLSSDHQTINAATALKQLFFEARLNPGTIEIRTFDQQSPAYRYSAIAVVSGIFYNQKALEIYEERALQTSARELEERTFVAAEGGLKESSLYEEAKELLKLSESGLVERNRGEEIFLLATQNILETKKTPAERLLENIGEIFHL